MDAPTNEGSRSAVHFGDFRFDRQSLTLWRGDALVPLQKLPARVLARLLDQPGRVVLRSELYADLWPASGATSEDSLNTAIAAVRSALGERASRPRFIVTVPRRGYRFTGNVAAATGTSRATSGPATAPGRGRGGPLRAAARIAAVAGAGVLAVALARLPRAATNSGAPTAADPPPEALELVERSSALARSGRLDHLNESLELLERVAELDPAYVPAHSRYATVGAMVAFFASEPSVLRGTREALRRVETLAPGSSEATAARGMLALYAHRDFPQAIRRLEAAIAEEPGSPLLSLGLADAYRRAGMWAEAEREYRSVLATDPTRVDAMADLALVYQRSRRWEEAEALYVRAIGLEPRRDDLVMGRAEAQLGGGASSESIIDMLLRSHRAGTVPPGYAVLLRPTLARTMGAKTDWRTTEVRWIAPGSRDVFLLNRAWLEARGGSPEAAERLYLEAVDLLEKATRPPASWRGIPSRHGWLGLAYAALGRHEEAHGKANELLERFPAAHDAVTSPHARRLAAEIFASTGELERSVELLEELLGVASEVTPARLAADPIYAPLHGHPRFQAMTEPERPAASR